MIDARSVLDLARAAAHELTGHLPGAHAVPDQPQQATRRTDTGNLWKWVDRLTLNRRQRLTRQIPGTEPHIEYVDIPSLWTQLLEATASTNHGGGRGKATSGSRTPIDLAIAALSAEVNDLVADALIAHGHTPRITLDRRWDVLSHDTRSDLRQLAAVIVTTGDDDLITWWADRYRTWVHRAQTALTTDDDTIDTRAVRGHACPNCQALWVTSERDHETFRDPALVIVFRDGQVLHITCRACGTGWWRGGDVDRLTRQIALGTAVRGPAELWGKTVPRQATN